MTLLDWLVVATVAAIVLVLLDGLRRKWVERRNRVVMKLDRNLPQEDIDLDLLPNSELPNGGARTVVRDADPSPNWRKRNIRLKDGRDQRTSDQKAYVPPVLMDPVEVEEESIEHANVFVKAEQPVVDLDESLIDDDLPPEVLAGLDSEFEDDAAVKARATSSDDEDEDDYDDEGQDDEEIDDAPHLEPLDDEDEDEDLLDLDDEELDDEDDEEFDEDEEEELFAPLAGEEEAERFEAELDDEEELAQVDEEDYEPVASERQLDDEDDDDSPAHAAGDHEDGEEGEEYPDDYEDEYADDYENEPHFLEGAYRKAASRFQRQPEPEQPRVEPGFGEAPSSEVEPVEDFSSAFDEGLMDEILDEEQAEIRAWRTQSVTQRDAPPAQPEAGSDKRKIRATAIDNPVSDADQGFFATEPDELDAQADVTVNEPAPMEKPSPVAKPREKSREPKKGFWESVTGKAAAKAAAGKAVAAKVNQGELFQEEPAAEPEPVEEQGPQEVIIINVMAKHGRYFRGDELLPLVQRYGMRLGNMSIFHRHADHTGTGPVMFSMANMVKPGTFSLSNVEEFMTPGVSFFVQLPNKFGNMKSFEQMLATAEGIRQTLDGDLKDERRSVFTRQTVEHCRQRIRDFELALLARK